MTTRIIILTLTVLFSNIFSSIQKDYIQGMVRVTLNRDLFKFPLEVYGAFISIENDSTSLEIDSLRLLSGSSLYIEGDIISYYDLVKNNSELASNISMDFDGEFIKELKKIDVYYIARGVREFNPADTLPHKIYVRGKIKVVKSPNFNLHLTIKYKSNKDAMKVAEEFKNLKCVENSGVNQILIEDHIEKPSIIYKEMPILPDSIEADTSSNIVVVTVLVDTLGNAEDVIIFSSRDERLNPFALNAAKKCKFTPARRNGKKMKMNVKFTFN